MSLPRQPLIRRVGNVHSICVSTCPLRAGSHFLLPNQTNTFTFNVSSLVSVPVMRGRVIVTVLCTSLVHVDEVYITGTRVAWTARTTVAPADARRRRPRRPRVSLRRPRRRRCTAAPPVAVARRVVLSPPPESTILRGRGHGVLR